MCAILNLCNVDGCKRESTARNLCQSHYARFIKYGDATVGGPIRIKTSIEGTCEVKGCFKIIYARRLCQKHHRRWIRHDNPIFRIYNENKGFICKVTQCNQNARSKGFCPNHYAMFYREQKEKEKYTRFS